jgi:hypothetical protein
MASGKASYLSKKLLDHSNAVAAYTEPTGLWVALCTTAGGSPTYSAAGTELTTNGYVRTAVTMGAATDGTGKATSANTNDIVLPIATGSNQPEVSYYELYDAVSGGNRMRWGALPTPFTQVVGALPVIIPVGGLANTEA